MITAFKNQKSKPLIIVAGGAGFIGSFLCETLLLQGCRVICLDDLSTGKKSNLNNCFKNSNFTFNPPNFEKKFDLELETGNFYIFDLTGKTAVCKKVINLAKKYNSRLVTANTSINKSILTKNLDYKVVIFNEVYGPRMNLGGSGIIKKFIRATIQKQKAIPPSESSVVGSFFVADVVYALIKIMFGITQGKEIKLGESNINWAPQVDLSEGIKQTLKYFQQGKKEKVTTHHKFFKPLLAVGLGLSILMLPVIFLFFNFYFGVVYLKNAKQTIEAGNFIKASQKANLSRTFFKRGVNFCSSLGEVKVKKIFYLGEQSAEVMANIAVLVEDGKSLLANIIQSPSATSQNKNFPDLLSKMKVNLDQIWLKISLIETETKNETSIYTWARPLTTNLSQIKDLVFQGKKGLELLPLMIGSSQLKTYLILLQNSSELRPTGGFIGAYALLVFNKGKIAGLEVKNVYEADGQLKGHVEPPPALKKHLGVANWYLRDANWDPDYQISAQRTAWFLEKETGQTVDGVIGLNLYLVRRILTVLGEVKLPDYNENITADNLFAKAEYYSEIKFFPGSTQKEDFLGALTGALFEKIKTVNQNDFSKLGRAVWESIKAKDLAIYLNQPTAAKILADLDWDGRLKEISCEQNCLADYLMIVEANLGVNKANYFVKRNLKHQVTIEDEGILETLIISYQNQSLSQNFPAGNYRNYLRILTPTATELIEVKIDGQLLDNKEIDQEETNGKKVFGLLVEVPIKSNKTIEITYRLSQKIGTDDLTRYVFYLQKQSGIEDKMFELEILPTKKLTVLSAMPSAKVLGQAYQFTPEFNQDLIFELKLAR